MSKLEFGIKLLEYIQNRRLVVVDNKFWEDFDDPSSYTNKELVQYFIELQQEDLNHNECVNCGSENITIHKDKDECHECGYIYE